MPESVIQCPLGMYFRAGEASFALFKSCSMNRIPSPFTSSIALGIGLFMALAVAAQDRAYVLCEGALDFQSGVVTESPRLGVIEIGGDAPVFSVLRVFEGHAFASDVMVAPDGQSLYVAAEDTVYRLDAGTGDVIAEQPLQGARKLAHFGDRVYVSRGDYDPVTWGSVPFDHYLVALDAEDLSWQAGWSAAMGEGPSFAAEGVCVAGGGLYVAVNNAFSYGEEVGLIGRVDLVSGQYTEEELGDFGLNPVHLFDAGDGAVVSVNARQYDGTSLSRWDGAGEAFTVNVAASTAGCGAAAWHADGILYQVYGEGGFRKADGMTLVENGAWDGNGQSVYAMAMLPGERVLLGMTDFATTGSVELWDLQGGWSWTVPVGVAPGRLVVSSTVSEVPAPDARTADRMGAWDILGRPMQDGTAGLRLVRWTDGTVTKEFRQAD